MNKQQSEKKQTTLVRVPALALRRKKAAAALDISPRLLAALTLEGAIPHVRLTPRVVLYDVAALQQWLSEQASKGGGE